jgi:hypothetical protein
MARAGKPHDPDDVESLLAQVERSLSGRPPARADASSRRTPARRWSGLPVTAGVAAALVGALFMLLPFLRAGSGAAGAFLGALLAGLWVRLRG